MKKNLKLKKEIKNIKPNISMLQDIKTEIGISTANKIKRFNYRALVAAAMVFVVVLSVLIPISFVFIKDRGSQGNDSIIVENPEDNNDGDDDNGNNDTRNVSFINLEAIASYQIKINEDNSLTEVTGLNEDASAIICNEKLPDNFSDILSELLKLTNEFGCFNQTDKIELIAINEITDKEKEIEDECIAIINNFISENKLECAIKTVSETNIKESVAYNTTPGKLELAKKITDNPETIKEYLQYGAEALIAEVYNYSEEKLKDFSDILSDYLSDFRVQAKEMYKEKSEILSDIKNKLSEINIVDKTIEEIKEGIRLYNDYLLNTYPEFYSQFVIRRYKYIRDKTKLIKLLNDTIEKIDAKRKQYLIKYEGETDKLKKEYLQWFKNGGDFDVETLFKTLLEEIFKPFENILQKI